MNAYAAKKNDINTPVSTIAAFIILALALRTAYALYIYFTIGVHSIDSYLDLGSGIFSRHEYSEVPGMPSLARSPGYPIWIAFLFFIFGHHPLIVLFGNAVLSAATCWVLHRIALRLFGKQIALLALVISAFYPFSIYYTGYAILESFAIFISTLLLLWIIRLYDSQNIKNMLFSGILSGILGITNPTCFIFLATVPAGLLIKCDFNFKKCLRFGFIYYAIIASFCAPWMARNYMVFGKPVLTNARAGINIYESMLISPDKMGTPDGIRIQQTDPTFTQGHKLIAEGKPIEAYDLLMNAAKKLIHANPEGYAKLVIHRIFKFWRPIPYKRSYDIDYKKVFWISLLSDGLIIPLGLFGIFLFRKRWTEFLPLYLMLIFWPLAYYLVYAVIRYRLPVMMPVIIFASAVIVRIWEKSQQHQDS